MTQFETQTHANEPRAVDNSSKQKYQNVAIDKRVWRGSTHMNMNSSMQSEQMIAQHQARMAPPKRSRQVIKVPEPDVWGVPLPDVSRDPIDLTSHLEAPDVAVQTATLGAQTDDFADLSDKGPYLPRKTGVDAETMVFGEEIFKLDEEMEPLVDVLVSKCMEQATMEVNEELAMETMADYRHNWMEDQSNLMDEWQSHVDAEAKRFEATQAIMREARRRAQAYQRVKNKAAAYTFARSFTQNVVEDVLNDLERKNAFQTQEELDVNLEFMPWLLNQVVAKNAQAQETEAAVDSMISNVINDKFNHQHQFINSLVEKDLERVRAIEEGVRVRKEAERLAAEEAAAAQAALDAEGGEE